ncbi:hypothetical protein SESBI_41980 [Sesbania bispinosa]|nr:hypothetical protein SESBI_41980 [Sesbania bispinosa]
MARTRQTGSRVPPRDLTSQSQPLTGDSEASGRYLWIEFHPNGWAFARTFELEEEQAFLGYFEEFLPKKIFAPYTDTYKRRNVNFRDEFWKVLNLEQKNIFYALEEATRDHPFPCRDLLDATDDDVVALLDSMARMNIIAEIRRAKLERIRANQATPPSSHLTPSPAPRVEVVGPDQAAVVAQNPKEKVVKVITKGGSSKGGSSKDPKIVSDTKLNSNIEVVPGSKEEESTKLEDDLKTVRQDLQNEKFFKGLDDKEKKDLQTKCEAQADLQVARVDLQATQTKLDETLKELEDIKVKLGESEAKLGEAETKLGETTTELIESRSEYAILNEKYNNSLLNLGAEAYENTIQQLKILNPNLVVPIPFVPRTEVVGDSERVLGLGKKLDVASAPSSSRLPTNEDPEAVSKDATIHLD